MKISFIMNNETILLFVSPEDSQISFYSKHMNNIGS